MKLSVKNWLIGNFQKKIVFITVFFRCVFSTFFVFLFVIVYLCLSCTLPRSDWWDAVLAIWAPFSLGSEFVSIINVVFFSNYAFFIWRAFKLHSVYIVHEDELAKFTWWFGQKYKDASFSFWFDLILTLNIVDVCNTFDLAISIVTERKLSICRRSLTVFTVFTVFTVLTAWQEL